jgi:hypothetical protein
MRRAPIAPRRPPPGSDLRLRAIPIDPALRARTTLARGFPARARRVRTVHMRPRVGHERAARLSQPDACAPLVAGNDWFPSPRLSCAAASRSHRWGRSAPTSAHYLQRFCVAVQPSHVHPQFRFHRQDHHPSSFQQQRRQQSAGPAAQRSPPHAGPRVRLHNAPNIVARHRYAGLCPPTSWPARQFMAVATMLWHIRTGGDTPGRGSPRELSMSRA